MASLALCVALPARADQPAAPSAPRPSGPSTPDWHEPGFRHLTFANGKQAWGVITKREATRFCFKAVAAQGWIPWGTVRSGEVATGDAVLLHEADTALATHEFDLVILDLGLPRLHGLEVLRKLRARGSTMPVLILTAADSVEQRVKGLDLGADDYMAKPFSLQELEARVRALTRRGLGTASSLIKHGPLTFDATGRVAYINEQMLELSARELSLLEVLLQRAGRIVRPAKLVDHLCEWGEEVSNNAIEVYIHRLRKKIEQGPIRIATVRGLGYCLEKIQG